MFNFALSSSKKDRQATRGSKSRFFDHPDLPQSPPPQHQQQQQSAAATTSPNTTHPPLNRRASSADRRSSIAVATSSAQPQASPSGLSRSQTIRESSGRARSSIAGSVALPVSAGDTSINPAFVSPTHISSPAWTPDPSNLPTPNEQPEYVDFDHAAFVPAEHSAYPTDSMSGAHSPGNTSQDLGSQAATLDRWSQRRLQRLNTEQGFREQRQGGHGALSPPANAPSIATASAEQQHSGYNSATQYANSSTDAQPHPPAFRTAQAIQPNVGLAIQTPSASNPSRSQQYPPPDLQSHVQQYSPPDSGPHHSTQEPARPSFNQARSYTQQGSADESSSMSNNGSMPLPKAARTGNGNRQSVHNGLTARDGSHSAQSGQGSAFNPSIQSPPNQGQPYKGSAQQPPAQQQQGDIGRATPQPLPVSDDLTPDEVDQLVKDHKELREKYTKVKKYYFEKEDQVKQLQNSLAHQRLSQSRTSLDDSEYTTRFNRLDGLIAQLAFSIRKSWKSIPQWLSGSVNRDAVVTGKQEMTAAGRAFISCWLVEEVFDKYFHPDLEPSLSTQLKGIQRNIRKHAPTAQTTEEEEYLTSKVVNWRLATLEGLQEALKSSTCTENRQKLIDTLKDSLVATLAVHLQDPPPSDLEGGVHMIIELVVSIAIHLPLESRDVVIEYFMPGYSIMTEQMKLESGIPQLTTSVTDDAAERASMKSATSDVTDMTENSNSDQPSKKRSMLSALTGAKPHKAQGKHAGAGGSSSSLHRPESAQGKEDMPPRVRMAAGIGVQVRGRSVLVKAPVFST